MMYWVRAATVIALLSLGCAGKSNQQDAPPPQSGCQPVTCEILCTNGFAKDENGCEICKCADAPAAACEPVTCEIHCENGFATDDKGCEICQCK